MITYEEFKKVDLRIGKVLSVEPHPNADRLYVIRVDLGDEQRQTVAGLKGHYTPEELVGRCVVVVTNLQPARLRGIESQGMLLACQDGTAVRLLQPDREAAPGSKVL